MKTPRIIALFVAIVVTVSAQAQSAKKPGPFASADSKLDYLLNSWTGRSLDELRSVWGTESSAIMRDPNRVFEYRRTSRAGARVSILGGQVSSSTEQVVCTAAFEVDGTGTIVEVTRQRGGRECWNLFNDYELPE